MNFFPALSHERNQKQYHPKSQESMILDTRAGTEKYKMNLEHFAVPECEEVF